MIVYHHTDMDGKSAAWLVHKMKPTSIEDRPQDYIPTDYNSKFDKHTIKDDVFLVDISISPATYDQFIELCKTARTVTWIDHHATSLDVIQKHKDELQAIANLTYFVSKCACGAALVYSFFKIPSAELQKIRQIEKDEEYSINAIYGNKGAIKITIQKSNKKNKADTTWYEYDIILPLWLYLVDDYDCWKGNDDRTDSFNLATSLVDTSIYYEDNKTNTCVFNVEVWDILSDSNYIDELVSRGRYVKTYLTNRYNDELNSSFTYTIDGVKFICKNGNGNSWNFGDKLKEYGQAILFHYDGKSGLWKYSVYADENSDFNAKEFAEKYGGGGHVKAAGFSTKELIFIIRSEQKINQIFLGGTVNSDWREEFIQYWKELEDKKAKDFKLFNPIVSNWTEECIEKENKAKKESKLSLFVVIHGNHVGPFSFVEATETSHIGKVFLAIYDQYGSLDDSTKKSYQAIGDIVEANGGKFAIYPQACSMKDIVSDVFDAL